MQEFSDWLQGQIDGRGWSKSELARRSGIDTGSISNVLSGMRKAGPEFCRKIAAGLGLPEAVVFYRAGLLSQDPQDPAQEIDPVALDLLRFFENRAVAEKLAILATVKALVDGFDRGKSGTATGTTEAVARQKP